MKNAFSPKDRFAAGPFAKAHLDWSRDDVSRAAIEASLAQMAMQNTGAPLMLMEGAAQLVRILLNIAEPQDKVEREDRSAIHSQPPPKKY